MHLLNIPGLHNSGADHWQTLWEEAFPERFKRVQQNNWSTPEKTQWVNALHTAIEHYASPVVLVAHSLGCITVAHWANEKKWPAVAGALLVAPADAEQSTRAGFTSFCPVPKNKLPFPSIVVASTNDPYAAMDNSLRLAGYWGSELVCVGDKGHINAQSGLQQWREGLSILSALTGNRLG